MNNLDSQNTKKKNKWQVGVGKRSAYERAQSHLFSLGGVGGVGLVRINNQPQIKHHTRIEEECVI